MCLCTPLVGGSVGLSHVDFQVWRKLLPTKKPHRMVWVYGSAVLFLRLVILFSLVVVVFLCFLS
jgi:hypothetical protein